jgi:hypothetical protein
LIAAVGVVMPALIVAPAAPVAEAEELAEADDEEELLQAARMDPIDEFAAGQPSGRELVDDVVSDVTLALAQAREPAMVNIPCHKKPPCFLL